MLARLESRSGEARARSISDLSRPEQVLVWALRHARAEPAARAARCAELSLLVGVRAVDIEAAIRGLRRAAAIAGLELAAPLACRCVAPNEQALLDALGAFHANQGGVFAAVLEALGGVRAPALEAELLRLAALLEASCVSFAGRGAATPPVRAAARWLH